MLTELRCVGGGGERMAGERACAIRSRREAQPDGTLGGAWGWPSAVPVTLAVQLTSLPAKPRRNRPLPGKYSGE